MHSTVEISRKSLIGSAEFGTAHERAKVQAAPESKPSFVEGGQFTFRGRRSIFFLRTIFLIKNL